MASSTICSPLPSSRNPDSHDFPSGAREFIGTARSASYGDHHSPPARDRTPQCSNKFLESLPRASTALVRSVSVAPPPARAFTAYANLAVAPSLDRSSIVFHASSSRLSRRASLASSTDRSRRAPSRVPRAAFKPSARLTSAASASSVARASSARNGSATPRATHRARPRAPVAVAVAVVVARRRRRASAGVVVASLARAPRASRCARAPPSRARAGAARVVARIALDARARARRVAMSRRRAASHRDASSADRRARRRRATTRTRRRATRDARSSSPCSSSTAGASWRGRRAR